MKNMGFFEGGGNILPASVGFVSMANYERANAFATGVGGAISIAIEQAQDAAGLNAKPVNVCRIWYTVDAPSAANGWQFIDTAAGGVAVVDSTTVPELAAIEGNVNEVFVEVLTDQMDGDGGFIYMQAADADHIVFCGGRYPQYEPINPLA